MLGAPYGRPNKDPLIHNCSLKSSTKTSDIEKVLLEQSSIETVISDHESHYYLSCLKKCQPIFDLAEIWFSNE